jgi:hypothetical protein
MSFRRAVTASPGGDGRICCRSSPAKVRLRIALAAATASTAVMARGQRRRTLAKTKPVVVIESADYD